MVAGPILQRLIISFSSITCKILFKFLVKLYLIKQSNYYNINFEFLDVMSSFMMEQTDFNKSNLNSFKLSSSYSYIKMNSKKSL